MKALDYHQRRRKPANQAARMSALWPEFGLVGVDSEVVSWRGPLRPFQRTYLIGVIWWYRTDDPPYVLMVDPKLRPREGKAFEDIPHLQFCSAEPELSGLCLFDPDGSQWSPRLAIADTTIGWASRWLYFYEQWHRTGEWRGGGVGPESIAKARAEAIRRKASELAHEAA